VFSFEFSYQAKYELQAQGDESEHSIMKNKAAWIVTPKQRPLKVDDAPMPVLGPQDIIIRNHAIAINRKRSHCQLQPVLT